MFVCACEYSITLSNHATESNGKTSLVPEWPGDKAMVKLEPSPTNADLNYMYQIIPLISILSVVLLSVK